MSQYKAFIEVIPKLAKEINTIVHIDTIKDAVNSASSVSGLILDLVLTPVLNKITEPTVKKFLKKLFSITENAVQETIPDKETLLKSKERGAIID